MYILHLSDLHLSDHNDPETVLQPLALDLRTTFGIKVIDFVVLSGDLTHRGSLAGLSCAAVFTKRLQEEFSVPSSRIVVVPGNHDVVREPDPYDYVKQLPPGQREGTFIPEGSGYLVRNETRYWERFHALSELYMKPVLGQPFWHDEKSQVSVKFFPPEGIGFIAFNSAHEIDSHFPKRASISQGAVAEALRVFNLENRRLKWSVERPLLFGVWHHAVTGNDKIRDSDFMELLARAGVHICLHGDVHEERSDLFNYQSPPSISVIGAGTFGAGGSDRGAGIPNQYNLLEVSADRVRVHTRARKGSGAWSAYAVWGNRALNPQAYYDVTY